MPKATPLQDILERYKNGEREFSGVICSADFNRLNLSGSVFKNSNMSFSSFDGADLTGCDFSGCNLEWSSFRRANMTGADFGKANLTYCDFSNAVFDKAILRDADLSWSIAFNTNIHAADVRGASLELVAFDASQLTKEGLEHVRMLLGRLKSQLPYELYLLLRFEISALHEKKERLDIRTNENKSSYATFSVGSGYSVLAVKETGASYTSGNPYAMANPYKTEQKKKGKFPFGL